MRLRPDYPLMTIVRRRGAPAPVLQNSRQRVADQQPLAIDNECERAALLLIL